MYKISEKKKKNYFKMKKIFSNLVFVIILQIKKIEKLRNYTFFLA